MEKLSQVESLLTVAHLNSRSENQPINFQIWNSQPNVLSPNEFNRFIFHWDLKSFSQSKRSVLKTDMIDIDASTSMSHL